MATPDRDLYHDGDRGLFRQFLNIGDPPGFVKEASFSPNAIDHISDQAFADPSNRRYPCHTRQDTYMSAAYFGLQHKQADDAPHIKQAIQKFARLWNIDVSHLLGLKQKEPTPADFALNLSFPENVQSFPLKNAAQVKTSAHKLLAARLRIPYRLRKQAASKILQAAYDRKALLQSKVVNELKKMAGDAFLNADKLQNAVAVRQHFVRKTYDHPNQAKELQRICASMSKAAEAVIKAASDDYTESVLATMDALDHRLDLKHKIPPVESVFDIEPVKASSIKLGGQDVPLQKIASIDQNVLSDIGIDLTKVTTFGAIDLDKLDKHLTPYSREMLRILV